jgi:3-methyladenine DNA glycosylase AlkC
MAEALKNMYNQDTVAELAAAIQAGYLPFDTQRFLEAVFDDDWDGRELKQRMRHITLALRPFLPQIFEEALPVLEQAMPRLSRQGFEKMVFPDFVELFGLERFRASMAALELFTQYVSAEFAVRPFIARYPQRTMTQMLAWASHDHESVRRLASEGCRPRLPWGMALPALVADPAPILPILEQLKHDASEAVRRSVANNLNDISKDHPDLVIGTLQGWQAIGSQEIRLITSHALRSLLKQGHPEALEILGYGADPAITVQQLKVAPQVVPAGGDLTISFDVLSLGGQPQQLMIDYVVHLVRANGTRSPKVFRLKTGTIHPGELVRISKRHSFRPVTSRRYYPGEHLIEPQINGKIFGQVSFTLAGSN